MFIDASAIIAILTDEPSGPELWRFLSRARSPITSPIAVYEATLGIRRKRGIPTGSAEKEVSNFMEAMHIQLIAIQPDMGLEALKAFARYGKGQGHPAQLNMGDCFAYAVAKTHNVPLLFTGNDFPHTDITPAA
ncbi:MAG: type II toxin-antitoxin system VapC family toxin [Acetobacteraceae bacterium]|nr:type II toxin-antitoxin system VapC family toxin [Acetobacteraceae bacterium]